MNHSDIEEHHVVERYVAGKLAPREVARFEEHYLDCAACCDAVEDATRLHRTGFDFIYPTFGAGWIETVRWYQEHGWLPEAPLPTTDDETQSQAA